MAFQLVATIKVSFIFSKIRMQPTWCNIQLEKQWRRECLASVVRGASTLIFECRLITIHNDGQIYHFENGINSVDQNEKHQI